MSMYCATVWKAFLHIRELIQHFEYHTYHLYNVQDAFHTFKQTTTQEEILSTLSIHSDNHCRSPQL